VGERSPEIQATLPHPLAPTSPDRGSTPIQSRHRQRFQDPTVARRVVQHTEREYAHPRSGARTVRPPNQESTGVTFMLGGDHVDGHRV
jgi:hypothetical protein